MSGDACVAIYPTRLVWLSSPRQWPPLVVGLSNAREWLTRSGPVGCWHSDAVRDLNMTYTAAASTAAVSAGQGKKRGGERNLAKQLQLKRTKFLQDTDRLYTNFSASVKQQIGSTD